MALALDGQSLDVPAIAGLANRSIPAVTDASLVERATSAAAAMVSVPAYGRSTGVGANRELIVDATDTGHALRLWSSHAAATGPLVDEEAVRAMLAVRLNQICTGRTGVSSDCAHALRRAVEADALPAVHHYGAVGTGDLTALAELGLCLAGRRPWWRLEGVAPEPITPTVGDGLGLLSSNALTVAVAALASHELTALSRAATMITAMSCVAAGTSSEAFSPVAWPERTAGAADAADRSVRLGSSGGAWVASVLTELVRGGGRRLQDPYPLRAAPAWHGPLVTALDELSAELRRELNRSTENPLLVPEVGRWLHHAAIVATELTAHLDATRAALVPAANGSLARIRLLHLTNVTGLPAFLAVGPPGSSGTMICEYSAAAAVAEIQQRSLSAALGWTTLSLGHEDGASFATQSAAAARDAVSPFRAVLTAEVIVAARALRIDGWPGEGLRSTASPLLGDVIDTVLAALPDDLGDHDLGPELELAAQLLPMLADASRAVGSGAGIQAISDWRQGAAS
ncbi:MAG: aromatic amino acid lyase [Actinomycetota bacterium]|nr:aromatic amino acid lyase [Actinomycetota bacterium]